MQVIVLRASFMMPATQLLHHLELHLIHNHCCPVPCVGIQPCSLVLLHINATMTARTCELLTTWIVVREVCTWAIVVSPPAVMEKVTIVVVLHRVINLRIGIPEGRSLRLTRLKDRRRLAQE